MASRTFFRCHSVLRVLWRMTEGKRLGAEYRFSSWRSQERRPRPQRGPKIARAAGGETDKDGAEPVVVTDRGSGAKQRTNSCPSVICGERRVLVSR